MTSHEEIEQIKHRVKNEEDDDEKNGFVWSEDKSHE